MEPSDRLQAFLRHELSKILAEETRDAELRKLRDKLRKRRERGNSLYYESNQLMPEGKEQTWRDILIEMSYHLIEQETKERDPRTIYRWIVQFLEENNLPKRSGRPYTINDIKRICHDFDCHERFDAIRQHLTDLFEYLFMTYQHETEPTK